MISDKHHEPRLLVSSFQSDGGRWCEWNQHLVNHGRYRKVLHPENVVHEWPRPGVWLAMEFILKSRHDALALGEIANHAIAHLIWRLLYSTLMRAQAAHFKTA